MDKTALNEFFDSLTLNEKIGQLLQVPPYIFIENGIVTGTVRENDFSQEYLENVGSVLNIFGKDKIRALQEMHLKHSRIPILFMADVIVGYDVIFPSGLSQGCTFDPELVEQLSRISATETAADGINVTFSPMVDLCRDARWGRVSESYGEDVLLNCRMAEAVVRGYQGEDLSALDTVSACVKHFAAYSAPISGRDYNSVDISERTLRQEYLRSYKAALDAGCAMIMTAFNTIAGVPCVINKHLLKDILRDEWGFNGVVITDWGSLSEQYSKGHAVATDSSDVAKYAIDATVDIEMVGSNLVNNIKNLIQDGVLSEEQINEAAFRVIELKNKLGLFENPYRYVDNDIYEKIDRIENLKVAKRAVVEGSVLLKNNDSVLPIDPVGTKVAFIGPYLYCSETLPVWSFHLKNKIVGPTMEKYLKDNYTDAQFTFSYGCPILDKDDWVSESCRENNEEYFENQDKYISDAVEKAKNADVVVLALGEHYAYHGESRSRADIRLHKIQRDLVDKIYEVNQNITAVIFSGRPLDITDISKKCKAILFVWEPGSMSSEGITDMLFGKELPSGKLSMCMPYCVGQMPIHYSELRTGRYAENGQKHSFGSRFLDAPIKPLYPFGYGLTYTTFEYSDLKINKAVLTPESELTVSVSVKNTGERDAWETVQMYINDVVGYMVSRPMKELKDFKRVFIKAGETVEVSFKITEEILRFYTYDMKFESEPGEFLVYVGADSNAENSLSFRLEK